MMVFRPRSGSFMAYGVLITIAFFSGIVIAYHLDHIPKWLTPLSLVFVCVFTMVLQYRRNRDYFSPAAIALFFFACMALRATRDVLVNYQGVANHPGLLSAIGAMGLALFAFLLGYFPSFGQRMASKYPTFSGRWNSSGVILIAMLFTMVALISYYLYVGPRGYIANLHGGRFEAQFGRGYLLWGIRLVFVPVLMLYCLYLLSGRRTFIHKAGLALYTVAVLGMLSALGLRELPVFLVVFLVVCHSYLRRISFKALVILIVVFAVFLVEYEQIRLYSGGLIPDWQVAVPLRSIGVLAERFSREFSFTRVISDVIMTWPSVRSFEWGATYLSLVFMPIPRAFWPGKPLGGVGALINQVINPRGSAAALGYYGFGYSPSMVGEAYLNFGWAGILVVFFLFGILARSAYAYINLHRRNPSAVVLYAVCLWSIFMELRGGFTNATTMWLINMFSITVALRFVTYRASTSPRR